ncbi:DUF2461 domain-containing protein [bacterium]|jgi:uncharacterized protein (TIGR02453 family)|nr:DUF2461 domain-containing protein [bacterium]
MKTSANFSKASIEFLKKASRQKRDTWLDRNRDDYEKLIRTPLTHLAETVFEELRSLAPDYHFPRKGLGRMKRPSNWVQEGGGIYKSWMSYSAARPRTSRFENNPNLYFMIDGDDDDDPVLVAGGLYMPSSQQLRKLREAIAYDASAFDELFATKEFSKRFKGGFSRDKTAKRPPRGFDPNHERIDWLKLQAFFVWRPYTIREFTSSSFARLVAHDFKLILKMNRLMEKVLSGKTMAVSPKPKRAKFRLEELEIVAPRPMDF